MMSYAGLVIIMVGAVLILVDQAQTYWDARASVEATKATVTSAVGRVEKTEEEWKNGLASVYSRQLDIEAKLAASEVKLDRAHSEVIEKMALFEKEQSRLRNTIAPRQVNPKLAAASHKAYDGTQLKMDLDKLRRRFDETVGKSVKNIPKVPGK